MAWTINTNMQDYLAQSGSLYTFFDGKYLQLKQSTNVIGYCQVNNRAPDSAGAVAVSFAPGVVVTPATCDGAAITSANGATVYATCSVSTVVADTGDIQFDDTAMTTGGQIVPNTLTFSLAGLGATTA